MVILPISLFAAAARHGLHHAILAMTATISLPYPYTPISYTIPSCPVFHLSVDFFLHVFLTLIPTRPSRMITLLLLLLLHSSRACQTIRITFQSRLLQLLSRHGRVRIRQLVPGGGRSGCNCGVGKLGSVFFESGVKGVLEVCSGSGHGGGFGLGIGVQVVDCGLQGRRSRVRTLVLLREKGE